MSFIEDADILEQVEERILGLEKDWKVKYADLDFVDLTGLLKDKSVEVELEYEQEDFEALWRQTAELYKKTRNLIQDDKLDEFIYGLLSEIEKIEIDIGNLNRAELELRSLIESHNLVSESLREEFAAKDKILKRLKGECMEFRRIVELMELEK